MEEVVKFEEASLRGSSSEDNKKNRISKDVTG